MTNLSFPANPSDGFQIKENLPGTGYVMWEYSEQFNQWTYVLHEQPLTGYVYTDQVKTREQTEDITTQQDVNHYLADTMSQRISVLEERVERLLNEKT